MEKFIDATTEAGKQFYQHFHTKGKVVMLNLLRFKPIADYSGLENLKPEQPISGKEAYAIYMEKTSVEIKKAGSKVLFFGTSKNFLIGPQSEYWDAVLLVEHESVAKFMAFARDENYLKTAGHRKAALEDSRLLPITEKQDLRKL